jgi:CcmD family protein
VKGGTYLFLAFLLTWGAFFAYAAYLGRRQTRLLRELESLRALLRGRDQGEGPDR